MWNRLIAWLDQTQLTDPLQRQQARVVQGILLVLALSVPLSIPVVTLNMRTPATQALGGLALLIGEIGYVSALFIIRRGHFSRGVLAGLSGMIVLLAIFAIPTGVLHNALMSLSFVIPIIMAGLLAGRRTVLAVLGLVIVATATVAVLEQPPYYLAGFQDDLPPAAAMISVTFIFALVGMVVAVFGAFFRRSLQSVQERQDELERLRASLEATVGDRTQSLEAALAEGAQREARLGQALAELQESRATIRDLSAPVVPVLPGVLVAPLVGALDEQRASAFAQQLLAGVEERRARTVIIDVTGVPLVDTHVAQTLLRAAGAVRLLGARTVLVGIRPEVAQTLVSLGVDLGAIPTYADLQEAVSEHLRASARAPAAREVGRSDARV